MKKSTYMHSLIIPAKDFFLPDQESQIYFILMDKVIQIRNP